MSSDLSFLEQARRTQWREELTKAVGVVTSIGGSKVFGGARRFR